MIERHAAGMALTVHNIIAVNETFMKHLCSKRKLEISNCYKKGKLKDHLPEVLSCIH